MNGYRLIIHGQYGRFEYLIDTDGRFLTIRDLAEALDELRRETPEYEVHRVVLEDVSPDDDYYDDEDCTCDLSSPAHDPACPVHRPDDDGDEDDEDAYDDPDDEIVDAVTAIARDMAEYRKRYDDPCPDDTGKGR